MSRSLLGPSRGKQPVTQPLGTQSAVSCLRFGGGGAGGGTATLLVSGGRDTDVIVWDVLSETGMCRLRGHKDQVTDVVSGELNARLLLQP
jgi:U3 small nucleolar RNA-associated protein 12